MNILSKIIRKILGDENKLFKILNNQILQLILIQFKLVYLSLYDIFKVEKKPELKIIERKNQGLIDTVKNIKCTEDINCIKYTDVKINFALKNSYILITDIIGSTRLYNENPCKMKEQIYCHDKVVRYLSKEFRGHIVANEGDSFHIAFENIFNAINFAINLRPQLKDNFIDFCVKISINQGAMSVRNFYGYKCYGEPINEALHIIKHNDGKHICIKESVLKESLMFPKWFCIHK